MTEFIYCYEVLLGFLTPPARAMPRRPSQIDSGGRSAAVLWSVYPSAVSRQRKAPRAPPVPRGVCASTESGLDAPLTERLYSSYPFVAVSLADTDIALALAGDTPRSRAGRAVCSDNQPHAVIAPHFHPGRLGQGDQYVKRMQINQTSR